MCRVFIKDTEKKRNYLNTISSATNLGKGYALLLSQNTNKAFFEKRKNSSSDVCTVT